MIKNENQIFNSNNFSKIYNYIFFNLLEKFEKARKYETPIQRKHDQRNLKF